MLIIQEPKLLAQKGKVHQVLITQETLKFLSDGPALPSFSLSKIY